MKLAPRPTLAAAIITLTAACVENVDIGLTKPDAANNNTADGGDTTPDSGAPEPDAGMNTPADSGVSPPPDSGVLPPQSCNTDQECRAGEYCESDFSHRVGDCLPCPDIQTTACPGGTAVTYPYGNGCVASTCECPPWATRSGFGGCTPETASGWLVLDPSTLTFFGLPINSVRYAVSGHDPVARTCVTLIWDYSNNGMDLGGHCDNFFDGFPYTIITPDTDGPCGQWDYGTDVVTNAASGCVDFAELGRQRFTTGTDFVDVVAEVTSTAFTGMIWVSNRWPLQPRPVNFVFRYWTDTPGEHIYVQDRDEQGEAGWVRVLKDGVAVGPGEPCDTTCPAQPACTRDHGLVHDIIRPGDYGGTAAFTWDGLVYNLPTAATCSVGQAAHPGEYEVEMCFGRSLLAADPGELVGNPECRRTTFTYPAAVVEIEVLEGG